MANGNASIVIAGYYGERNWGDEASVAAMLQVVPNEQACVLSGDPAWTAKTYQTQAIARMPIQPLKQTIARSCALLLGGGSLLQDATSLRSLVYYLALIHWGMKAHGNVALVAQGIGPLHRSVSRRLTRWILRRVPLISVRDEDSARLLQKIGLRQEIEVYADLTWALQGQMSQVKPDREVALAPRAWKNLPIQVAFTRLSIHIQQQGLKPVLMPMQESEDIPLCLAIADGVESQTGVRPKVIQGLNHPGEVIDLFYRFQSAVAVRLHAAIFAAKAGVPVMTVPYDPKVEALSERLRLVQSPLDELESRWESLQAQQNDLLERLRQGANEMRVSAEACLGRIKDWLSLIKG